jgi:hypothetical protein
MATIHPQNPRKRLVLAAIFGQGTGDPARSR